MPSRMTTYPAWLSGVGRCDGDEDALDDPPAPPSTADASAAEVAGEDAEALWRLLASLRGRGDARVLFAAVEARLARTGPPPETFYTPALADIASTCVEV